MLKESISCQRTRVQNGTMADPFDLERFVRAQENVYSEVVAQLSRGRKTSHWMWFIFPQLKGLGHSQMATFYGIGSRAEAEAYLQHPVLGPRLLQCTALMNAVEGKSVDEVLGYPDDLKFQSSMTLFAEVGGESFSAALAKYFHGRTDSATLKLLSRG